VKKFISNREEKVAIYKLKLTLWRLKLPTFQIHERRKLFFQLKEERKKKDHEKTKKA
jgi:hypothetical protein